MLHSRAPDATTDQPSFGFTASSRHLKDPLTLDSHNCLRAENTHPGGTTWQSTGEYYRLSTRQRVSSSLLMQTARSAKFRRIARHASSNDHHTSSSRTSGCKEKDKALPGEVTLLFRYSADQHTRGSRFSGAPAISRCVAGQTSFQPTSFKLKIELTWQQASPSTQ